MWQKALKTLDKLFLERMRFVIRSELAFSAELLK